MPTRKTRINVSLDEEILNQVDAVMEEQGILERTSFVRNAIEYYLVALTTDDKAKAVVTKDTTKEIKRTINPLSSQLEESNRVTQIMLNVIWKKINQDKKISDDELTKIVSDAIKEVDEDKGMSVNKILKSAKNVNQNFGAGENFKQSFQQNLEKNKIQNSDFIQKTQTENIEHKPSEVISEKTKQESVAQNQQPIQSRFSESAQENQEKNQNSNSEHQNTSSGMWGWGKNIFSE